MVLRWFDQPDTREELRITDMDIIMTQQSPLLGDSYILKAHLYNPGGTGTSSVVRFLDGDNVVGSDNIYVAENGRSTAEVVWTPLFAGNRTLSVHADPGESIAEVFETNNVATLETPVYFFYDDMENGAALWNHSDVLLNIFAHELQLQGKLRIDEQDVFDAVEGVHRRCRGGYAAVLMIPGFGICGFRDPFGIRPVVYGKRELAVIITGSGFTPGSTVLYNGRRHAADVNPAGTEIRVTLDTSGLAMGKYAVKVANAAGQEVPIKRKLVVY